MQFKPEFLNRLDEVVVFTPLSSQELREITDNLLAGIAAQSSKEKSVGLRFDPNLVDTIVTSSASKSRRYGARPLKRTVLRYVEDALSDAMVAGFLRAGDEAVVGLEAGGERVTICKGEVTKAYQIQAEEEDLEAASSRARDESSNPAVMTQP